MVDPVVVMRMNIQHRACSNIFEVSAGGASVPEMTTRLDPPTYLDHLHRETARFREAVLAAPEGARVPSCPDWDVDDLLGHLAGVQQWWADNLRNRPAAPEDTAEAEPPAGREARLAWFDEGAAALRRQLDDTVDVPSESAWTWSSDHTVGFIQRRQAHEALIHRADAELASGPVGPIDPLLAADGVAEVIEVMYGGRPPWGTFVPEPDYLRIDLRDAGVSLWVQLGRFGGTDPGSGKTYDDEPDLALLDGAPDGAEAAVVITGAAGDVDLWLWRRGDDATIEVEGDRGVYDRFRAAVDHPIN